MDKRYWRIGVCVAWLLLTPEVLSADRETAGTAITTTEAITRTLTATMTVRGDLESPAVPTVAAEIPGRIVTVKVEEGDDVRAGQVLARLDSEAHRIALERAEASIQRLKALIENQRVTLKRYQGLVAHQSSAQSELDKAKTDLLVFQADLAVARAHLKEVHYQLSKTEILSPLTGAVQQRRVAVGDYVKEGDSLFQVVATDRLQARLHVPETLSGRIQCGMPVELRMPEREQVVKAEITRLRPMLDPGNRALEALAEFDGHADLRPGSSIIATVELDKHENAVLVPELSLVRRPAGIVVYRIANRKAEQRVVQTGMRDGDWIEILAGVEAGETIALDGAGFLTEGAPVVIRDSPQ